jgi:hypothetical protein
MLGTADPATADPVAGTAVSPPARRFRPARWSEPRLLLGLLLVLGSVVGVGAVVSAADRTESVWVARTALAPGMSVEASDVEQAAVRLPAPDRYLGPSASPVGAVVLRPVAAGELVPAAAVAGPAGAPARRLVTVPVERHHQPVDLGRGEQVDVYLVEQDATGTAVGDPSLVLAGVTVDGVDDGSSRFAGSSLETGVVLAVEPDDVATLLGADSRGDLVLVRVPGD